MVHRDGAWVEQATAEERARSLLRLRHRGWRTTPIRLLSGARLNLETPYLSEDLSRRPGPTRGVGRRGKNGTGRYPVLEALGVLNRTTPALASEIARQAARTASFDEAQQALAERGVNVTKETVRNLTLKIGEEALKQRAARADLAEREVVLSDEFAGQRVVISVDGGRIRMREGASEAGKARRASAAGIEPRGANPSWSRPTWSTRRAGRSATRSPSTTARWRTPTQPSSSWRPS